MTEFLPLLSGASDFAIFALVAMMWRLDRRLVRLETLLNGTGDD